MSSHFYGAVGQSGIPEISGPENWIEYNVAHGKIGLHFHGSLKSENWFCSIMDSTGNEQFHIEHGVLTSNNDALILGEGDHRIRSSWIDSKSEVAIVSTNLLELWEDHHKVFVHGGGGQLNVFVILFSAREQSVESILVNPDLLSVSASHIWEIIVGVWKKVAVRLVE